MCNLQMVYWGSGTNICMSLFNFKRDRTKSVRHGDRIESKRSHLDFPRNCELK